MAGVRSTVRASPPRRIAWTRPRVTQNETGFVVLGVMEFMDVARG
jgi:hypothetical protein